LDDAEDDAEDDAPSWEESRADMMESDGMQMSAGGSMRRS